MPQASDEFRAKMQAMFGDPVGDEGPQEFLKNAGYTLTPDWWWKPPKQYTSAQEAINAMSEDEYACYWFLITEWDFGGIKL